MKKQLILGIAILISGLARAQELNCTVTVLTAQIQSSDKKIYTTLQTAIYEFMNNTRWTDDQFTNQERIECSIQINISDRPSNDEFKGSIQVQSRRPIYKTSYHSPILNINDESFDFRYIEYQSIEFNESGSNQSLPAILAFYAYMILGSDYDTFSPEGGSAYLQKAQTIVANQQQAPDRGWKAFENDHNRYWLAENFNNPLFKPIRDLLYTYHRKGMDIMADKKEDAITIVAQSVEGLRPLYVDKPSNYLMQTILFAKAEEMISIFKDAPPDIKTKMVNSLSEFDPANGTRYQAIMNKN